jgi:hypothetical protein
MSTRTLYDELSEVVDGPDDDDDPPGTIITKAIETVDNDYAAMMLPSPGMPIG